tara:strand:- start:50 stop:796 length:747 start_codon:yes stop_codon:yes gene_type:complete
MQGKFYTATIKPTTFVVGDMNGGAYDANDVLFDWHEFKIPTGTANLKGMTIICRGNDGTAQTLAGNVYFATCGDFSLGTSDAAVTAKQTYNYLMGHVPVVAGDHSPALGNSKIANIVTEPPVTMFTPRADLLGAAKSNIGSDGYTSYWIGMMATGTPNFASTVTINMTDAGDLAALGTAVLTVNEKSPLDTMSPGDVLIAHDGAAVGTIKSIDSTTQITLTSPHTDALAEDDELYVQSPITFLLHLEY